VPCNGPENKSWKANPKYCKWQLIIFVSVQLFPLQPAGPKTSPLVQTSPQGPLPPSAVAAMQPQVAVPVFPTGGAQLQSTPPPPPPGPPPNPVIRPVQSPDSPKPKAPPVSPPVQVQNEPGSIYVPPVTSRSQVGSLYIPPINSTSLQEPAVTSQRQQTPASPLPSLNKAPTPWMSQHQRQQQNAPSWVNREEPQHPAGTTHIIPIQVRGLNFAGAQVIIIIITIIINSASLIQTCIWARPASRPLGTKGSCPCRPSSWSVKLATRIV
jgi:hypothetical protein